ncbi:MAG: type VI secretion system baseplate subunit TssG [Telluria sp.]
MPTTKRRDRPAIIAALLQEPYRFQFFQAVRLILQWLVENGVPPEKALTSFLRFDNSLRLDFSPSQIESLRVLSAGGIGTEDQMLEALHQRNGMRIRITPAFIGLLGGNGALPFHYTERIAAAQQDTRDEGPRAFMDMLSGRVIALFFEAWTKHRVETAGSAHAPVLKPLLLSLAGFQHGTRWNNSDGLADDAIAYYAGLLQQRHVSAPALQALLSEHFQVPVEIDESVGRWSALSAEERSAVGGGNAVLGGNAMLGGRTWRPDLKARLRIGPLPRTHYDCFMPHTRAAVALAKFLSVLGSPTLVFEIQVILRAQDVKRTRLEPSPRRMRLGFDSFLVTGAAPGDMCMRYEIRPRPLMPKRILADGGFRCRESLHA